MVLAASLGCAGGPPVSGDARAREDDATPIAWLGVRGTRCEAVLPALGLATSLRQGTVSPWRVAEQGPWCAVAPTGGGAGLRIDSSAQHLSAELGLPALSFFVARGAWSYTVFDRGEPVLSLESHVGEPIFSGDAMRAAALLEVDTEVVSETEGRGREPAALERFAAAIGLADPGAEARVVEAERHVAGGGDDAAPTPERTLAKIPPGSWAALPPLGVVLVKAVEVGEGEDGEPVATYVIVDDMATLRLPVARAEAMGMRPVAARGEVARALKVIEAGVELDEERYDAARVKGWLGTLATGDLIGIARVYATLCELAATRRLYQLEEGLLATSRDWLAEEIATAQHTQRDAIEQSLRALCE